VPESSTPAASTVPAVLTGLARQSAVLEAALAGGEIQCGWKVGFGSATGLETLGLDGPIIGHLLRSGERDSGAEVHISGWTKPVIEAEIACWIARDVPSDVSVDCIGDYVAAVGPALEVADVDHVPADPDRILAGNIFHRGYVLGPAHADLTFEQAARLTASFVHGEETIAVLDPDELTGHLPAVLARAASLAPLLGRTLAKGDVILLGSIIAPRPVASGDKVSYRLGEDPALSLRFV